jgi:hypothetical protein
VSCSEYIFLNVLKDEPRIAVDGVQEQTGATAKWHQLMAASFPATWR